MCDTWLAHAPGHGSELGSNCQVDCMTLKKYRYKKWPQCGNVFKNLLLQVGQQDPGAGGSGLAHSLSGQLIGVHVM